MSTTTTAAQATADLQAQATAIEGGLTALQNSYQQILTAIQQLQGQVGNPAGVDRTVVEAVVARLQTAASGMSALATTETTEATSVEPPSSPQAEKSGPTGEGK